MYINLSDERIKQYTYTVANTKSRFNGLIPQSPVTPGLYGFDASAWQTEIDFEIAKAAGLNWVYLRGLYGLIPDTKFPTHFPNAKGVMKRTAYLYYKDQDSPQLQAQKLYDICLENGDIGDFMPILDLENIGNPTLTASKVKACLDELTSLFGVKPLIYSGYYVITNDLTGDKTFLINYSLIIAAYPFISWTSDLPTKILNYPPLIPSPFTMWTDDEDETLVGKVVAWQFCANAPASEFGVSGNNLDLDLCSPAFAKQVLTSPVTTEVKVNLENKIQATHTVKPINGVHLFEASTGDGWKLGLSFGEYVRVLNPTENGRVRVRLIHKGAGMCYGWITASTLEELETPVTVTAIFPSENNLPSLQNQLNELRHITPTHKVNRTSGSGQIKLRGIEDGEELYDLKHETELQFIGTQDTSYYVRAEIGTWPVIGAIKNTDWESYVVAI